MRLSLGVMPHQVRTHGGRKHLCGKTPPTPQPTESLDGGQVWGGNHLAVKRLAGANSGTLGLPF